MTFEDPDDDLRAIEQAMDENIRLGYVELVGVEADGEPCYRLTPTGEAHVRELLAD